MFDRETPSVKPPKRQKGYISQWVLAAIERVKVINHVLTHALSLVAARIHSWIKGLSGRLLIVSLIFVAVVEVVILIPSMAAFQENWLYDRIAKAEIASLALDASDDKTVSKGFSKQLLTSAGVLYLAIQNNGVRDYVLRDPTTEVPDYSFDLRRSHSSLMGDLRYLYAPWKTLMANKDAVMLYQARPRVRRGSLIEVVVPLDDLKADLWAHLISLMRMSMGIAVAAGLLVYYALHYWILRPIERLTHSISDFKADPEAVAIAAKPTRRSDEIGHIENELLAMQDEVRHALRSKARLAALGQAVSKINHDLRNMLTSAQLASERLSRSGDPTVTKTLPRLERALDRALNLAGNVLTYGKSDEHEPRFQILILKDLAIAAAEDAGLGINKQSAEPVRFFLKAPRGFHFEADPDHMHRVLVNLMRNARQALTLQANRKSGGRVTLSAEQSAQKVVIAISDNGPGISEKTKEKLFQPFALSATPGGTGLGLAIARELVQLHGGDLVLAETGAGGTRFEIQLPLSQ